MLDKSKYPNKQSIGEEARKSADGYFNHVRKETARLNKSAKKVKKVKKEKNENSM